MFSSIDNAAKSAAIAFVMSGALHVATAGEIRVNAIAPFVSLHILRSVHDLTSFLSGEGLLQISGIPVRTVRPRVELT